MLVLLLGCVSIVGSWWEVEADALPEPVDPDCPDCVTCIKFRDDQAVQSMAYDSEAGAWWAAVPGEWSDAAGPIEATMFPFGWASPQEWTVKGSGKRIVVEQNGVVLDDEPSLSSCPLDW